MAAVTGRMLMICCGVRTKFILNTDIVHEHYSYIESPRRTWL